MTPYRDRREAGYYDPKQQAKKSEPAKRKAAPKKAAKK